MIIKVILLGICVCVLNVFLRQTQNTFIIVLNLCYIAFVAVILFDFAADTIESIKKILNFSTSADKMFMCLFKGTLMCILTKISSDLCKESGNIVVSDIIDLAGRIMLFILAFPFVESIIKTAAAFVL